MPRLALIIAGLLLQAWAACNSSEPQPGKPGATKTSPAAQSSVPVLPRDEIRQYQIQGVERSALVVLPASAAKSSPVMLAFHGHGGNSQQVQRSMRLEEHWPEAVVVYPLGLPSSTRLDPRGVRPGWQVRPGINDDRDLKFTDEIIKALRAEGWIDEARIYATGHSNGAGFVCLLGAARPGVFAAIAPVHGASVAAVAAEPLPWLFVAGRGDEIVKFDGQDEVLQAVLKHTGCTGEPSPWGDGAQMWSSAGGTPVVAYIHEGGHRYPREAAPMIVRFFKGQARASNLSPVAK